MTRRDNQISAVKSVVDQNLSYAQTAYEAVNQADALVLVTEWPEYKRPNFDKISQAMKSKFIFDLRNQWNFKGLVKSGFHYECIGRPDSAAAASPSVPVK